MYTIKYEDYSKSSFAWYFGGKFVLEANFFPQSQTQLSEKQLTH